MRSAYEPPATGDATRRARVRALVHETAAALGWPPSPLEIRAWAVAHRQHPAAAALDIRPGRRGGHFGSDLNAVAGRPSKRTGRPLLANYSDRMMTDGGVVLRVGAPDMSLAARATARFIDVCFRLRPLDEFASCDRLHAEAQDVHLAVLGQLAGFRAQRTLAAIEHEMALVCGDEDIPWVEIGSRIERGAVALREWWASVRHGRRARVPRWITDVEAADRALACVHAALPVDPERLHLELAGGLGLRPLTDATAWVLEILQPEGRRPATPGTHVVRARRFPNPRCDRGPLYDETREALSLLDVGDVLDILAEFRSQAELSVLLRTAVDVMGYAVRDPGLLRWLLTNLPRSETLYRQGAVVALGALGSTVAIDDVVRGPRDMAGLNAYALAIALSPMRIADRIARIDEVVRALGQECWQWAREVTDRFADGATIGAIM